MPGLIGMKAICEYCCRSEATMLKLIREFDFPAVKIGGIWESDKRSIDDWRRDQVETRGGTRPQKEAIS